MTEEYKWWEYTESGHEVMSRRYPMGIEWSDKHRCRFVNATKKLKKEIPNYTESIKNIMKGE